ncbi:hypothetical protein GIB67_022541 [Kingdonia uniflora]|uniref:4-coumarate--CoA ligase n=1 Tax=Kingdonia uniflora TaxID=39325 RepID=A0A7J7L7A3_9MAGN|nr:hypothetical protein GIB67_022541 [Kingdonia uniflora]
MPASSRIRTELMESSVMDKYMVSISPSIGILGIGGRPKVISPVVDSFEPLKPVIIVVEAFTESARPKTSIALQNKTSVALSVWMRSVWFFCVHLFLFVALERGHADLPFSDFFSMAICFGSSRNAPLQIKSFWNVLISYGTRMTSQVNVCHLDGFEIGNGIKWCGFPIKGYGMTEAGSVLSMGVAFAKEPLEIKSGSCGTVIRNAEIKIIDPDTSAFLPRNKPGENLQIMKGYLNDPEAWERTIDKEGWLHTGDIGYIDDDDEIFIVDRLKKLIKYEGFQVAPVELEAMLLTHPKISDLAIVSMKDDNAGEVPVAFVVWANRYKITEEEIKQFISKQVTLFPHPIPNLLEGSLMDWFNTMSLK